MSSGIHPRARLAAGLLALVLAAGGAFGQTGVVIDAVPRGGAGESAGLRPADVLLTWTRAARPPANPEPAAGEFRSFFDVVEVCVEQAPRGPVEVQGLRDGKLLTATLSEVEPWFLARPQLLPELLAEYEDGRRLLGEGRVDEGLTIWRRKLLAPEGGLDPESAASILLAAAWGLNQQSLTAPASRLCEEALLQARRGVRPHVLATTLQALAGALGGGSETRTLELAREAVSVREALGPDSLALTEALNALATSLNRGGQIEAAQAVRGRADELVSRLAPGSLALESQRYIQARTLWARGDLAAAEELARQVQKRVEELAPGSLDLVIALQFLTSVVAQRGSIEGEVFGERAVAIAKHLGREPAALGALINLGDAKTHRGDLEGAETVLRRADELYRRTDPESVGHAFVLNNLGEVLAARGDWESAEPLFSRTLQIFEASGWTNSIAQVLVNVARADLALGHLDPAEQRFQQAVELHEKILPGSPAHAEALTAQGELAERRDDWERAWALHTRAQEMLERAGIGGAWQARSLYRLGLVARRRGDGAKALGLLQRAIATVEAASGQAAASDLGRAAFSALNGGLYRETIDLLVDTGRPAEAFALLERWRARWLLVSMAERDLDFGLDVPAELEADRREQERRYAETRARLSQPSVLRDAAESERLRGELSRLVEQGQQLAERVRRASPRFAALRYPQALDLLGVQASLDPGSVLVSYSVGPTRTLLFVVTAPRRAGGTAGFAHYVLPVGEPELRARVTAFRNLLQRRPGGSAGAEPELRRASRELFDLLLAPAADAIEGAQRVVLSPDGPLHTLPFAALTRPAPAGSSNQRYVAEWKPLTMTVSATLQAQLRTQPSAPPAGRLALAAFGDPTTASEPAAGERLRTRAARLGVVGLESLPASRLEVERLARAYGASARTFVRAEASEANVQRVAAQADRLHFACHGLLDSSSPLNSALVLAPQPGATTPAGDGLLEAWEVLEHVRLRADLVTLSACETGLGQELGGEGLGSLTRAFLYAGARSVVASLWSVADASTADLMTAFYRELRAGTPKDEALRRAQAGLLRGRHRHPFHWAAFQLHGDSR